MPNVHLVSALLLVAACTVVPANDDRWFDIEGRVIDAAGNPVASADIELSIPALNLVEQLTTNEEGEFGFLAVHHVPPPLTYTLRVTKAGRPVAFGTFVWPRTQPLVLTSQDR